MQINSELLKTWKKLKSHGDIGKLAKELDCTTVTVATILNTGKCKDRYFAKMCVFFQKKADLFDKYLNGAKKAV